MALGRVDDKAIAHITGKRWVEMEIVVSGTSEQVWQAVATGPGYTAWFRDSRIKRIERYGPGEPDAEGSVKLAEFRIVGQDILSIDSPAKHQFAFTPSISLFVECESETELDTLFGQLSESGQVLMPLGDYSGRTTVEWRFSAREDATTFVVITESGWRGNGDELVRYVAESTQGFTWTLAGAKAFLEHGIKLNLIADVMPDAHVEGWGQV